MPRDRRGHPPLPSPRSSRAAHDQSARRLARTSQRGMRESGVSTSDTSRSSPQGAPRDRRCARVSPRGYRWRCERALRRGRSPRARRPNPQMGRGRRSATRYGSAHRSRREARERRRRDAVDRVLASAELVGSRCMGGAIGVTKLGPKEIRIELVGWPCAASATRATGCAA